MENRAACSLLWSRLHFYKQKNCKSVFFFSLFTLTILPFSKRKFNHLTIRPYLWGNTAPTVMCIITGIPTKTATNNYFHCWLRCRLINIWSLKYQKIGENAVTLSQNVSWRIHIHFLYDQQFTGQRYSIYYHRKQRKNHIKSLNNMQIT